MFLSKYATSSKQSNELMLYYPYTEYDVFPDYLSIYTLGKKGCCTPIIGNNIVLERFSFGHKG